VTEAVAAPVLEKSAAPNSTCRMLSVKSTSTVSGMVNNNVGKIDTRATNQVCSRNPPGEGWLEHQDDGVQ
jgi:hypothetical protein